MDLSETARASLESIQGLDPLSVARTTDLGTRFDFTPAVPTVSRIVKFFRQLPLDLIDELPDAQRNQVESYADAIWRTIQMILVFDPNQSNASAERQALINQLSSQYNDAFSSFATAVAYLAAQQSDRSKFDAELLQYVENAHRTSAELSEVKIQVEQDAQRMLDEIRKVSAESGISQKASYFGDQAVSDAEAASKWQRRTNLLALLLLAFAVVALGIGLFYEPSNAYQAAQLIFSKVLVVSTIAYLLFLSGRTLMAHRHNEVVNRHRQNALLTFNALVDAAPSEQTREVVLTHASACIYSPQDSGFTKASTPGPSSLIEVAPRIMGATHAGSASG